MSSPVPVLLMVRELGIGGCERDLAKIALHIDRSRFTPHVACFIAEGLRAAELREGEVPILHLPVTSLINSSVFRGLADFRTYVRSHGIRLMHAFDVPTSIFGVPAARMAGLPVAIASQLSYRDLAYPRDRVLLHLADRISNAVVVNSWAVHQHLVEDEKVAPQKVFVSWNGVDTEVFYPGPGTRPPQFSADDIVVGTVAALRPEKRVHLIVRAFARAAQQYPRLRCLIVGSGPEQALIERTIAETGVGDRVWLEPARPDVAGFLRTIDIFVHASRSESFPNAVLEAMACGCAVVGTRVGGIPELVDDGVTGILFESGNENELTAALLRLAGDTSLRRQFSSAAAARALTLFPISAAADRLQNLYQDLLSGHKLPNVNRLTGEITR